MSETHDLLSGLQNLKTKVNTGTAAGAASKQRFEPRGNRNAFGKKKFKLNDGNSRSVTALSFQTKLDQDDGESVDNTHLNTNILLTSEYLKQIHDSDPDATLTFKDIVSQLKLSKTEYKSLYNTLTLGTEKIKFLSPSEEDVTKKKTPAFAEYPGTFVYKTIYNITNGKDLLKFLNEQLTYKGIAVRDLKDGWPKCNVTVNELEMNGKLIVLRTKKDNTPRYIWKNNFRFTNRVKEQILKDYERQQTDSKERAILAQQQQGSQSRYAKYKNMDRRDKTRTNPYQLFIDEEFRDMWEDTKLPSRQEIPRKLEDLGLKPASIDPSTIIKKGTITKVDVKKKRARRSKVTNTHMAGLLKDYNT
ncbi:hypothetical protein QEN19_001238 [Hanseniaspora menglaensis]